MNISTKLFAEHAAAIAGDDYAGEQFAPRPQDTAARLARRSATPKGFRHSAQGCDAVPPPIIGPGVATLGNLPQEISNPERVPSYHFDPAPAQPGIVVSVENAPGCSGPDIGFVQLRDGRFLEISEDGLCIWLTRQDFDNGSGPGDIDPEFRITFYLKPSVPSAPDHRVASCKNPNPVTSC